MTLSWKSFLQRIEAGMTHSRVIFPSRCPFTPDCIAAVNHVKKFRVGSHLDVMSIGRSTPIDQCQSGWTGLTAATFINSGISRRSWLSGWVHIHKDILTVSECRSDSVGIPLEVDKVAWARLHTAGAPLSPGVDQSNSRCVPILAWMEEVSRPADFPPLSIVFESGSDIVVAEIKWKFSSSTAELTLLMRSLAERLSSTTPVLHCCLQGVGNVLLLLASN